MDAGTLDFLPLWAIALLIFGVVLASIEGGFRAGGYRRRQARVEGEGPVSAIAAATLGLLAFLLAFTFSQAASFFDNRRGLVLAEANAIGTTYLRSEMLAEPQRQHVQALLREYVQVRVTGVQSGHFEEAIRTSEEIQRKLWSATVAVAEKQPGSIVVGLFIQTVNETIDLHARRVSAGLHVRVPGSVWAGLFFITMIGMSALGYHEGFVGQCRSYVNLGLALAFSAVLVLIVDLDRPADGLLRTSQQALLDLQESMKLPAVKRAP